MDHYAVTLDNVAQLIAYFNESLDTIPFDEGTEAVMLQNAITLNCLALRVVLAKKQLHTFNRMMGRLGISLYCMPKCIAVDEREQAELRKRGVEVATERVSASQLFVQLACTRGCGSAALSALHRMASQESGPLIANAFESFAPVWNLMLHKNYAAAITIVDLLYDAEHPHHADAMNAKIAAIALTGRLEAFLARQFDTDQPDALEKWSSAYAIAARVCNELTRERQANPCPWRRQLGGSA